MTARDDELVPCPACEGHGEISTHQNSWGQWETEQCRPCQGQGEVRRSFAALLGSVAS